MASMGTGGRSGTSDAERSNRLDQDTGALPRDMATDALGEPVGVVNMMTLEATEPTPAGTTLEEPAQPGWFRWWHVPAVTLPLAAGATATILLLRRRRQQQVPVSTYNRLVNQGRGWLDQALSNQAAQSAVTSLQQGVTSMRGSALRVPETATALRDRSAELLAAAAATVAASAAARRAAESAQSTLDAATRFWNSRTPTARQVKRAAREQGGTFTARLNGVRLGLMDVFSNMQADKQLAAARASMMRSASKAGRSVQEFTRISKPTAVATKSSAKSSAKASRVTRRATKRANEAFDRTRAFTLGMFVTAMLTYIRMWRRRMLERETRETASGRLVRDA